MNWLLIFMLVASVGFLGYIGVYYLFFRNKGRKVLVEIYEKHGDALVRAYMDKKIFGYQRRDDGVEKIFLPKFLSKVPIEGVSPDMLIRSNSRISILELVKEGEEIFRPLKRELRDEQRLLNIIKERDAVDFYLTERVRLMDKYKKSDFLSKYGTFVTIGVLGIFALMIIFTTAQQINELNDDYRQETLGEVKAQRSFLMDMVNNIKGENNNIDTDAEKPPGQK